MAPIVTLSQNLFASAGVKFGVGSKHGVMGQCGLRIRNVKKRRVTRIRILLVEDHKATSETLTRLLKKAESRLEVFSVGTLAEGIEQSVALKADVTLLDLCLPDASSWQVTASAIRKFHPPVIVISDLDGPEIVAECMKNGAQQVFSKRIAIKFISAVLSAISAARMRVIAAEQFGAGHDSTP